MAIGDDATAAGIPLVSKTTDTVANGADHHNVTRDELARRTSAVLPVAKGGTGATTAAAARTNLGVPAITHGHSTYDVLLADGVTVLQTFLAGEQGRLNNIIATAVKQGGGDIHTGPGRFNSQGSRAFTVSSNYASAYIDGDNWFGISPSALRFKTDVERHDYTLGEAMRLAECVATYRLLDAVYAQGDDAPGEVGVIAEWLIDAGFAEFVVFGDDGLPLTVAYERLVTVALGGLLELGRRHIELELGVEQLLEREQQLLERVAKLEAGA